MGLGEAQRQINVIRQAIDQDTKSGAKVDFVLGVVAATTGNYASIYLDGNDTEASENFRVPAWLYVNVGDPVLCAVDYGSNLGKWVVEVLPTGTYSKRALNPNTGEWYTSDGTTTPVSESVGGNHPDLAEHDALGLATQAELDAHGHTHDGLTGVTARQHTQALSHQSGASGGAGQYTKIANGSIPSQFNGPTVNMLVTSAGIGGSAGYHAIVQLRLHQQAAFGNQPYVELYVFPLRGFVGSDFVCVVTSVAGPTTWELWMRHPVAWMIPIVKPLGYNGEGAVTVTFTENAAPGGLSGGTQYTGTTVGNHPDLASHDALGLATQEDLNVHGTNASGHSGVGGVDISRIVYGNNSNKNGGQVDPNAALASGFYEVVNSGSMPTGDWYWMVNIRHSNEANHYGFQLAGRINANQLWIRRVENGGWSGWSLLSDTSHSHADIRTIRTARAGTGTVGTGSSVLITLTWNAAFANTNYTATAVVEDNNTGTGGNGFFTQVASRSASQIVVRATNTTSGSRSGTIHAIGVAD